ncbi:MAG: hypothetical protein C4320_04765, partial [Armatimonadota bacterium]
LALYYGAWPAYLNAVVSRIPFLPIGPDEVSMIGVTRDAGRIVIANNVAQLVETGGSFGGNETESGGATEGAVKKRLPIQDMLRAIAGDGAALGRMAMKMNDVHQDEKWPTEPVIWPTARIETALAGDSTERARLERDLNMTLDGRPLPRLSPRAAANGIIIETSVTIDGVVNGKPTRVTGPYQTPYKPKLFEQLEKKLENRAYTERDLANEYGALAAPVLTGKVPPENVAQTLRDQLDAKLTATRMEPVERLLRKSTVIVNSQMIAGAEYRQRETNDGTVYDLTIRLTETGRQRLWKYSHDRIGTQILFVVKGTAIAAPRISHDLRQDELVIDQLRDLSLVKDAVAVINHTVAR